MGPDGLTLVVLYYSPAMFVTHARALSHCFTVKGILHKLQNNGQSSKYDCIS